ERTLEGGAQASGQTPVGLCIGAAADLVALYDEDPMLVGHDDESRLDALVFSGFRLPIERVMVHGEWRVIDGDHIDQMAARDGFAASLERLGGSA
ncbi:MAG: formimidoylglutamate deiminase, partial [Proteobacteria bacterium]|nr:formimidoylglutamate deiminase [Pseudomonadota bacterium]